MLDSVLLSLLCSLGLYKGPAPLLTSHTAHGRRRRRAVITSEKFTHVCPHTHTLLTNDTCVCVHRLWLCGRVSLSVTH